MQYVPRILFEIELEYTRSRGPGGQHVNRTNSAALLRWNVPSTVVFSEEEKSLLLTRLQNQISQDGDIILRSDEFRDQEANRKKCLEKLDALITKAFFTPKKRKATRPTKASKVRRQTQKRQRGEIKSHRGKIRGWEE
ncbi:MAG: alternative ribosome rescue aminoacyl-tRNA hydrolase ArfB [Pseudobdellovibrionaceae bacterium]